MTPSEAKNVNGIPPKLQKSLAQDGVSRKPSFKCPVPNRGGTQQRITRKVTLPTSTVQALTSKFNELSQKNQTTIVKNIRGSSKQIKVVICRKPSGLKNKKRVVATATRLVTEDKGSSSFRLNVSQINESQRNVLQKITEFEERTENAMKDMKRKTSVPKVLVDIDLSDDKCLKNNEEVPKLDKCQRNSLSVKTAIDIFEKSVGKPTEKKDAQIEVPVKETVKQKPVATIKPILIKLDLEEKPPAKTKLSPRDSLYRKKYLGMKRDHSKSPEQEQPPENKSMEELKNSSALHNRIHPIVKNSEEIQNKENQPVELLKNNNASIFSQISQSNINRMGQKDPKQRQFARLLKTEAEEPAKDEIITNEPARKPNASFLWSKKEENNEAPLEKKPSLSRIDMPLPLPPENFVPDLSNTCLIYDDIRPFNQDETFENNSNDSDETVYDDIGSYNQSNEGYEKIYNNNELKDETNYDSINDKVQKMNFINENSNGKSDSLYCISDKLAYNYDDGEGEGYQYIRTDPPKTVQVVTKDFETESYQYVRDNGDENNIYEDIQSVKNRSKGKDKGIYEEVNGNNVNNCYESVYNGIYANADGSSAYIRSNVSDTSNNSGKSTYEKSNSIYGMAPGVIENGVARTSPTNTSDNSDNIGYHTTPYGEPRPNSETSQSNSDEWVEVSDSESEHTVYVVQERARKPRSGAAGWSHKVRRRWSKLQKKSNQAIEESKAANSEDHFYESIGQYEADGVLHEENEQTLQNVESYNLTEQIYSDDQCIDDFDSQSSDDELNIDAAKLPEIPHNGYNITQSLKAAGKRLRKNLSLRKSDLSKSLKRFKRPSRPKIDENIFTENTDLDLNKSENDQNSSTYVANSDSSSSSHTFNKSNSSNDIKTIRHKKSWTFRNKFKRNSSTDESDNSDIKNSTFYLSLNEVKAQAAEKKDDLVNEIQKLISNRTSSSLENVSEPKKDTNRRQSQPINIAKARPSIPPPPPPNRAENGSDCTKYSDIILRKDKTINNSQLYEESGLFDKQKKRSRCVSDSSTSWYREVGLYAANENSSQGKKSQMFLDEPLYQFYTECVNQQARDDILKNYDSEGYEEINDYYSIINEKRRTLDIKNVRPNFEDFNDDPPPKTSPFRSQNRTLWCQIPVVIDSCILETLSDQHKKLQEAKFEILSSEGSYMNSLNVLENHFMNKISQLNIITKRDFKILFGNILDVKKSAESFLSDLENCWQDNIMLNGICDIVYKHAVNNFQVYVKYCKNQVCIYRTLRELIDKNSSFENALKEIENDPVCQSLSIHSFLMLPMQRITRLPLLLGAVLARLDKTDDEYEICKASFEVLNKIVQECDDEARKMEKCEEILILSQQIEFPKEIRGIPIITGSRFLVKRGQVTQLVNRDENKLTFGRKFTKNSLTLFLFTDLLIVAKKKNVRSYVVVDHCPRNLVQLQTEGLNQLPVKLNTSSDMSGKLLMLLTMLENHERKTVEMILSFEMESDRQRWLEAMTPKQSLNPNESIYEEWDCPQVIAIYEFTSAQPDELSLCIGDVVNVLKKMNDGWYQGERLRDGARGWFPQNHTQEILSPHVRAKNKKQRYRLLALSGNFIESQMKNGK